MIAIRQFLLFLLVAALIVSLVPLLTLLATGKLRESWAALRGYMVCLGLIAAAAGIGLLAGLIGSIS